MLGGDEVLHVVFVKKFKDMLFCNLVAKVSQDDHAVSFFNPRGQSCIKILHEGGSWMSVVVIVIQILDVLGMDCEFPTSIICAVGNGPVSAHNT